MGGDGEFGGELQQCAVRGLERGAEGGVGAFLAVSVPVMACGLQLVGLNVKLGRLTMTFTRFIWTGIPSMVCGMAWGRWGRS